MTYLYDFGDGWEHSVTLEKRLLPDIQLRRPRCIGGQNACPPEDVGCPVGYMNYLEALLDPQHEEHQDMLNWRGPGFHPAKFSVAIAESRLQAEFG